MQRKIVLIIAVYAIARMIQTPLENDAPCSRLKCIAICLVSAIALLVLIPQAAVVFLWDLYW